MKWIALVIVSVGVATSVAQTEVAAPTDADVRSYYIAKSRYKDKIASGDIKIETFKVKKERDPDVPLPLYKIDVEAVLSSASGIHAECLDPGANCMLQSVYDEQFVRVPAGGHFRARLKIRYRFRPGEGWYKTLDEEQLSETVQSSGQAQSTGNNPSSHDPAAPTPLAGSPRSAAAIPPPATPVPPPSKEGDIVGTWIAAANEARGAQSTNSDGAKFELSSDGGKIVGTSQYTRNGCSAALALTASGRQDGNDVWEFKEKMTGNKGLKFLVCGAEYRLRVERLPDGRYYFHHIDPFTGIVSWVANTKRQNP